MTESEARGIHARLDAIDKRLGEGNEIMREFTGMIAAHETRLNSIDARCHERAENTKEAASQKAADRRTMIGVCVGAVMSGIGSVIAICIALFKH